eukprot:gene27570-18108_t
MSAFVATLPAFQQALCVGGNLADVTAKGQAMVKSVQLKSLNRERAEMAIEEYLRSGKIPNSALVASKEHMILPPDIDGGFLPSRIIPVNKLLRTSRHTCIQKSLKPAVFLLAPFDLVTDHNPRMYLNTDIDGGFLPSRIVPVNKLLRTPEDLPPLLQRYKRSNFMVKLMPPESGHSQGPKLPWSKPGPQILVGHLRFCIRREMLAKAGSSSSLASGMSWQSIQQSMDQKSLEAIQVEAQQRASKGRAQLMRVLDQQGWKEVDKNARSPGV